MTEPVIVCPRCKTEIKLTESLAAPLIDSTRREYELRLSQKDAEIAKREETVAKAREKLDSDVAEKLKQERAKIVADEARKAKLALATEFDQKTKEVADLQEVLKQRDAKLAEAQTAQADLVRKQRELDDTKRELELTVERRVQQSLEAAREQARKEAEEHLKLKEQSIVALQKDIAALKQKDAEMAKREATLREREESLSKSKEALEKEVQEKLKTERSKIAADEARKAKLALGTELEQKAKELGELQDVLKQRDAKLAEAQKAQAELIRKQRELDDAKREMELTVEKRVQESLGAARDQARKEAEEQLKLKVAEKELTITGLQKQIDELKQKAEQGSQQLQGEAQELMLEELLRVKFPRDTIEAVAKGEHGGDVKHHVAGPLGQMCGMILWESKRTKNWSDGWLPKLREDQRAAKAEVAVIVSQNLPKGMDTFECRDGIWITHPRTLLPVAELLRFAIIEVAQARKASDGQQTKMEMLYEYLTGSRFRQRVQAIVEAFGTMQEELLKEKKAMLNQWAKREKQIENVMQSTVGMYGDLQGIAGKTLQAIDGLELPALDGPTTDDAKGASK